MAVHIKGPPDTQSNCPIILTVSLMNGAYVNQSSIQSTLPFIRDCFYIRPFRAFPKVEHRKSTLFIISSTFGLPIFALINLP